MRDLRPTDAGAPVLADRHGPGVRQGADPLVLQDGAVAGGIDRTGAAGALGHDGPGGVVTRSARTVAIVIPLRTGRGQNDRLHWRAKAKQVKAEKEAVAWSLGGKTRPALPCVVTLTRVAPSVGLDDDNNSGSLKGCRDSVAHWLGVDDRDARVRWAYGQERGPWAVKVEIQECAA